MSTSSSSANPPISPRRKRPIIWLSGALALVVVLVISWRIARLPAPRLYPKPSFIRPSGMAAVAFKAFVQACNAAKVHPFRVTQTLGDAPRSVGYHLSDGTIDGEKYSAAVDLGVSDLSPQKRVELLEAMARVGFAAWYRSGSNWKGIEHVHAVYAGLPLKSQLQGQVRLWNRERRRDGKKSFKWQKKWRKYWN